MFFLLVDNFESRGQLTNFVQHFSNLSGSKFLRQNFQRSECTQGMTWRVTANEQLAAFLPIFYLFVSLVSLIVSPAPPCTALCHMSYSAPWRCLNPSNMISLRRKDFCTFVGSTNIHGPQILTSVYLKRGRLLHSYCQVGRSVKLLRGGRENGYIVVKVQTWYKSCQHLPNWHNWQAKDANMLGHVQIDAVIPDRHSSCPPCNKMTHKEHLEKNLVLPIQPFCSLPAQLDDPNCCKQVTGSSTLQQAGPSRLSFANFVLLDCSLCNLPALQLIRIVCNRLTNVIWHTIALLFYVCGNILQKKCVITATH